MGELVFIGLGLFDESDITMKGLKEARSCEHLFTEAYTSRLMGASIERLSSLYGREVKVLSREEVEGGETVVQAAQTGRVGFLVPGDPMAATTHVDLRLRAHRLGIPTRVVAGVSSLTAAAGALGLQAYKFGRTITLPFWEEGYSPESPYEALRKNRAGGLHTLVLLDVRDGKHMTAREGIEWLLGAEGEGYPEAFGPDTLVCTVSRLGSESPLLRAGRAIEVLEEDLGSPLHLLVVPGQLHFMEVEALVAFAGLPAGVA